MMTGDCRKIRELMDSYISGELSVESNHEVLMHVERCDGCRSELARRERVRALLRDSLAISPDAAAMTARVTAMLDREPHRVRRVMRYAGIAAALLLITGAGIWFSRPVDAAAFDDSVDDHIACALTYPPEFTYDAARAASALEPRYQPILNALSLDYGAYRLIDAHMCPYQGRNYAHVIYRGNGQALSVFAETSSRGRLPLTHQTPRKGFVSAGASSGGHQVFVVSDSDVKPPPAVVEALMQSTLAFVRSLERRSE